MHTSRPTRRLALLSLALPALAALACSTADPTGVETASAGSTSIASTAGQTTTSGGGTTDTLDPSTSLPTSGGSDSASGPVLDFGGSDSTTGGGTTGELTTGEPVVPFCGDGNLDPLEECDQGPMNADDGACTLGCKSAACGDGLVQTGVEACDDGNQDDTDNCLSTCLDMDPALAACVQLGLAGPHLAPSPEPVTRPPLTMSAFGMHLHAATTVDGRDRKQLERLCRYLLRPPFAHDAVQALPDGRVRVLFKAAWRSGAAHADMPPDKFLARLCALVPPPGFHQTRYYGVFANRHHLRPRIIPPSVVPAPGQQLPLGLAGAASDGPGETAEAADSRPRRLGWANLLARVFAVDVTICRACGGRMRVVAVVTDPDDIARILRGARAPPRPPRPHPPGQVLLFAC